MRFTGKVAVITAFANGIGRATAEIMAREGATVVGVDNHQGRLDEAVVALRGAGGTAHGRLCDALDGGQVAATVAAVDQEFGGVDILVNAVGGSTIIANSGARIEELKPAEWQGLIDFNLRDNQRDGPRTTIDENAAKAVGTRAGARAEARWWSFEVDTPLEVYTYFHGSV